MRVLSGTAAESSRWLKNIDASTKPRNRSSSLGEEPEKSDRQSPPRLVDTLSIAGLESSTPISFGRRPLSSLLSWEPASSSSRESITSCHTGRCATTASRSPPCCNRQQFPWRWWRRIRSVPSSVRTWHPPLSKRLRKRCRFRSEASVSPCGTPPGSRPALRYSTCLRSRSTSSCRRAWLSGWATYTITDGGRTVDALIMYRTALGLHQLGQTFLAPGIRVDFHPRGEHWWRCSVSCQRAADNRPV